MGIFYVVDFRTIDIGSSEENMEWEVCVLIHISHTQQDRNARRPVLALSHIEFKFLKMKQKQIKWR
jgi:hypothetical protein